MNIAIVGYGDQGRSALEYWNTPNNQITVCDQNVVEGLPQGVQTNFGVGYLNNLYVYDLIVRTPALYPQEIVDDNPEDPKILDKVTTVTNEFFKVCPAPIIGVTGTKGKGTTSTLIATILQKAGKRVHLGGNIGTPPLDLLKSNIQPTDWVVLELANFQLIDLRYSPHVAVCLMIAPEHLDWHPDMYDYVHSKQRMFLHQHSNDLTVYNADNLYSEEIADVSPGLKITYQVPPPDQEPDEPNGAYVSGKHIYMQGNKVCNTRDVALLGRHNLENVCAAIAATWQIIGGNKKIIREVLKTFRGLPYRLEIIRDYKGILLVDDSFGTTPETAIVAMQSFKQPKIMILGGSDKNAPFGELAQKIAEGNVKHVVAIGETGPKIVEAIAAYKQVRQVPVSLLDQSVKMPDIVRTALTYAQKGDVVLLSPACASFGMFANYKDRGEQFKAAALALA